MVADAMGITDLDLHHEIEILSLRGQLMDLYAIADAVEALGPDRYRLIILDAWYRALPDGFSENDNQQITALYNRIDRATKACNAAWLNVHHLSKGDQSGKAQTDLGAGAGAQSRAPDAHITLRQHAEPGTFVMEAAVRSFPPVKPMAIRWEFPIWKSTEADPAKTRTPQTGKKERENKEGIDAIIDVLRKAAKPLPLRTAMGLAGMGQGKFQRLAADLSRDGHVEISEAGRSIMYGLTPPERGDVTP